MKKFRKIGKRIGIVILTAILLAGYIPVLPANAAQPLVSDSDSDQEGMIKEAGTPGSGEGSNGTEVPSEKERTSEGEAREETSEGAVKEDSSEDGRTSEEASPEDGKISEGASEELELSEESTEDMAVSEEEKGSSEDALEDTPENTSEDISEVLEETMEAEDAEEAEESEETEEDRVSIELSGPALMEGADENGMARLGDRISIEVTEPGYVLARIEKDKNGNFIYTAMELDYDNVYAFVAEEEMDFMVIDPDEAGFVILNASSNKAKLTGTQGIKLNSVASPAQGTNEIVLEFTAVANASDGTDKEDVYYEVKVRGIKEKDKELPKGDIGEEPVYYYALKKKDSSTQSMSIIVNSADGNNSAATYEFTVKMAYLPKGIGFDGKKSTICYSETEGIVSGNAITKKFSTKNLYYEDKIGFTKKNTTLYTGQRNVLVGKVKYSSKASYLHNLSMEVEGYTGGIKGYFENANDELYISVEPYVNPGKYKVNIYAGALGSNPKTPQNGQMYQSCTSFDITVKPGISYIKTNSPSVVLLGKKDLSFNLNAVGYCGGNDQKGARQKLIYEVYSGEVTSDGQDIIDRDATKNVSENVKVSSSGKVTIKKDFTIDEDSSKNYFAILIRAADFEGNSTTKTVFIRVARDEITPKEIYLVDNKNNRLKTTLSLDEANDMNVIVKDDKGNTINEYVTITPENDGKKKDAYVTRIYSGGILTVNKPGTYTLKATTKYGGNKSVSVKLKITPPVISELSFDYCEIIYKGYPYKIATKEEDNKYVFTAPARSVLFFDLKATVKDKLTSTDKDRMDLTYSVSGGKVNIFENYWLITPSKKTCKLTIWQKADPKKKWVYEFQNNGMSVPAKPKVTCISGKVYDKSFENREDTYYQELIYSYKGGEVNKISVGYDFKPTNVKATPPNFEFSYNEEKQTISLRVKADGWKPGTYTYYFIFYDFDNNPVGVPIKVKVNKAPKLKITSSYTLDTSKESKITLKNTPGEFRPDYYTKMLNANVGGKPNDFTDYFTLAYETDASGKRVARICLSDKVKEEDLKKLKGKTMTGYVKYSYSYGGHYIDGCITKVSIKIK